MSIRYSERLEEAGINPSVGNTGSAYDDALAQTINGFYKTEMIHRRPRWEIKAAVKLGNARMGGLVQPSTLAGVNRRYPAG